MTATPAPLRVGIVGLGWMGRVHARAYLRLRQHYLDAPRQPLLVAVSDTAEDDRLATAVAAFGFASVHRDWRELVGRDDLDAVSVTGPNYLHRDVAVAAARAGKHVWVEKPAGRDAGETEEIRAAVHAAGVQSAVGFNYRNAPAVEVARALVADRRLGRVTSVAVRMLADYAAHPDGALTWRFQRAWAGSGVLGDLVSHGIDLARHVVGEIEALVADTAIVVPERPRAGASASHFSRGGGGPLGPVENEDYAAALLRFAGGARGTLEASRTAVGEQCTYGIEVRGERGALAWDFRRMGELRLCLDSDYTDGAWSTRYVAPGDGELGQFQPGSGIAMGYDDLKVIEAERFVRSIATGRPVGATIEDAVAAARLVDAMQASVVSGGWERP
nr:Gfo/Idh/MocA family oxidoreductase [uncultured Friedmanniella sp.]